MIARSLLAVALATTPVLAQASAAGPVFTNDVDLHDLPNGLRLVVVPTGFPDIVSLHIVVATGSRNEIEEGKSGFAHFFEHMMFRGSENYTAAEQTAIFKRAGADRNAYTTDDYTNYHTTFAKEDLGQVLQLEADRFRRLRYTPEVFRTESMAVLGEYNKNSANPATKLLEVIRDAAFTTHTYKHTTMGFLRDIRAMPRQYDYSLEFFGRWYRPEYVTILVVGDVDPRATLGLVEKYWGDWPRGGYTATIPVEPEQQQPLVLHVPWPAPTPPWIVVAFKGPAFSTERKDMAAMDLIASLAFSPNSELYKKLFVREGKVSLLAPMFGDHKDPSLLAILARVKRAEDVGHVQSAILETCERLQTELVDPELLARVKSHERYAFAANLDSSEAIAEALAPYIALARTPEAVNAVFRLYEQITPADLQAMARRYFRAEGRTIATLSHGPLPVQLAPSSPPNPGVGPARGAHSAVKTVLQPSESPLVSIRVLFKHGARHDPADKPGLAYVTARLLARGSTQSRSYEQIVEALFPMAASIDFQVDKEMTVFSGTVHRDNLAAFADLFLEMLAQPGWKPADLERVKSNTISYLETEIAAANDEELGKEVLYNEIYRGHPYGHHAAGTAAAVNGMTIEDVQWGRAALRRDDLVLGLAGGYPPEFVWDFGDRLTDALAVTVADAGGDLPPPPAIERNRLTIVQKKALATGIHFGFPIDVTRADPDFAALWLVRSYFGEHRSENSHLYQKLREIRGINYGDYAYIEYFPRGMFQFHPDPNLARRSQIFQVWIRPVPPEKALFTLKAAHWELQQLLQRGMTAADFEATRTFLSKFVNLLVKTQDRRLGYALDSEFYGIGEFAPYIRERLAALTLDDVNRAMRKHLRADRMQFVVVTEDADGFAGQLLKGAPGAITYQAEPPAEILREDALIKEHRIELRPEDVKIVPATEVFAR